MKKILLLSLIMATSALAYAEPRHITRHHTKGEPTVYLITVRETDTLWSNNPALAMQHPTAQRNAAVQAAIADHHHANRRGFQQVGKPSVIFANTHNSFSFAIGGYVALRASYGFNSTIDNIDVVPYDVPVPGNYATKQKIEMDATTSRIYMRGVANTRKLGKVILYFDADFRGGSEGSYTPRIRSAYVSMFGLTVGRDVSTFCDLQAAPTTIDFQGPNAYNFNFSTMIRYEHSFFDNHLTIGAAAELPKVSGTYGTTLAPIPQRMPDMPVYVQYAWGERRQSHVRASAVFRNMYLQNLSRDTNTDLFGWGVQLSGHINFARMFHLFFNGVYGEGITPYIQDLTGSGLDFTPNPMDPNRVQTMPMYGWQAAMQFDILPNLFVSGGYSSVSVCRHNGYYATDQYKMGQYAFGNIFYCITPRFKIAAEYLWAARENMDSTDNSANRINFMVRYDF